MGDQTTCPSLPETFAENFRAITTDGNSIYGFGPNAILAIDEQGAKRSVVDGVDPSAAWTLLVDDDSVFWSQYSPGNDSATISHAPKTGGTSIRLANGAAGRLQILMDHDRLYYVGQDASISTILKSGGGSKAVIRPERSPLLVDVDAASIRWLEEYGPLNNISRLNRASREGGSATQVAEWDNNDHPARITTSNDEAVFVYGFGTITRIHKTEPTGAEQIYDASKMQNPPSGDRTTAAAQDGGQLYWGTLFDSCPVSMHCGVILARLGADGSAPVALVSSAAFKPMNAAITSVVVLNQSVYFTSGATTFRVCK